MDDFLVYPWESIASACFPNWDACVYTLLKFGRKLIPHTLYISGSKVRLFRAGPNRPSYDGIIRGTGFGAAGLTLIGTNTISFYISSVIHQVRIGCGDYVYIILTPC